MPPLVPVLRPLPCDIEVMPSTLYAAGPGEMCGWNVEIFCPISPPRLRGVNDSGVYAPGLFPCIKLTCRFSFPHRCFHGMLGCLSVPGDESHLARIAAAWAERVLR